MEGCRNVKDHVPIDYHLVILYYSDKFPQESRRPLSKTILNSHPILNETPVSWLGIERLRSACLGMVILDIETLSLMEGQLFTPRELGKSLRMGPRRQKSFFAARVALKNLSRQLGLVGENRPDRTIETLGPDNLSPCLAESELYCSASHSSRFVVAVAHRHPVGVDIEAVSHKIIRIQHLFLSPGEQQLISQSGLDLKQTATRIWPAKEAAAKALGLHLFQAIREIEVVKVGKEASMLRYQAKQYPVRHGEGDGQVMALLSCGDL